MNKTEVVNMSSKKKEVYLAYGLEGELLYVGQGNVGRNSHCLNGCSHNKSLNRYYFLNGEDGSITTVVYNYYACEKEAIAKEVELIKELKPLYNANHTTPIPFKDRAKTGKKQSFKELAQEYYQVSETIKEYRSVGKCVNDLEDKLTVLESLDRNFGEIVREIGIEEIKSTYYNSTKSKRKYNKSVGVCESSKLKIKALQELNLSEGDFRSYSELKGSIQNIYDRLNLDFSAKATDIKEMYNVKRTKRQGVEGFLIEGKI